MFFYNTVEDPDWTAVLYAALIMLSVPIIILGFFKVAHKIVSPSPIKQPWSSIFIQFIFGITLFSFGAIKITSHSKSADTKSSDSEPSSSAPSSTEPTTAPIPETSDISSDIIGYTLMIIAAAFLIVLIIVLIARKATATRKARTKLQRQIQHSRDTNAAQLREIMTAFTTESTNPTNIMKYQFYANAEHPANRAFVTAMMFAYKEQQALDEAIAKYFKRNPGMISTHRFEKAVAETAKCWDMLNEVQQETQRLITRQRGAQQKAQQKAQDVIQRYVSLLQPRIQEINEIFSAAADAETQQDPNVTGTNGIT